MKIYLFLIVSLISFSAKSQSLIYHAFPDSNAYWCMSDHWFDGTCDHISNYTIYFGNDTVINGVMYHKLKQSGTSYSTSCGGGGNIYSSFYAGLRQDTMLRKVFIYFNSLGTERLLYDFNLQPGDTLNTGNVLWGDINYFVISSIDSVLINGTYRKRFNYSDTIGCNLDSSIIEGIGCTAGLISAPSNCFEYFASLTGFTQNGTGMYPNANANCGVITKNGELKIEKQLQIYPNLVVDFMNIVLDSNEPSEFTLYDISTRKVIELKFTQSAYLNLEFLSKGIYVYKISNRNGLIKKGKIVKV